MSRAKSGKFWRRSALMWGASKTAVMAGGEVEPVYRNPLHADYFGRTYTNDCIEDKQKPLQTDWLATPQRGFHGGSRLSPLADERAIHREFGSLLGATDEDISEWASANGFLGRHAWYVNVRDVPSIAETLADWRREIGIVAMLGDLLVSTRDKSDESAGKIAAFMVNVDAMSVEILGGHPVYGGTGSEWLKNEYLAGFGLTQNDVPFFHFGIDAEFAYMAGRGEWRRDPCAIAEAIVAEFASQLMFKGVASILAPRKDNKKNKAGEVVNRLALISVPRDLLGAIHFSLAREVADPDIVVKKCAAEGCGKWFIQTHGRQRYCSDKHQLRNKRKTVPTENILNQNLS